MIKKIMWALSSPTALFLLTVAAEAGRSGS